MKQHVLSDLLHSQIHKHKHPGTHLTEQISELGHISQEFASVKVLIAQSFHPFQIVSNEERRSNFDRYGQVHENQHTGQSQHHRFHGFHNSFFFDESFFHFPRYPISRYVL